MIRWFLIWRIIELVIVFLAIMFMHSSSNYQYFIVNEYNVYHIPRFVFDSANFDGANYIGIAERGYGLFQQAFFPLFPASINLLSHLIQGGVKDNGNFFIAGFLFSNICFLIGLIVFHRYLEKLGKNRREITWILLFLLFFPTSFFFGSVYTEGPFFLFLCATLYFAQSKHYAKVVLTAVLASLTRLIGVFLVIPLFMTIFLEQLTFRFPQKKVNFKYFKPLLVVLSPILGLAIYMIYCDITVHDPFALYHSQSGYNSGRSTSAFILLPQVIFRYTKIFLTAQHNLIYFVSVVEFVIFTLVFCVLLYDLWVLWKKKKSEKLLSRIGLNLFSLINIVLPTVTGTFLSIPRFALLSLSFFIRLAEIRNRWIKIVILILFGILHIYLLALFSMGYFIS